MIALAPLLAFGRSWWKAGAGAVLGAALALPVGQCQGKAQERQAAALRGAEAVAVAQAKNHAASEAAAVQRLDDTLATRQLEQDLSHADDAAPDARPSDARRALLCARMRDQAARGGPAVPADCGPAR